MNPIAGHYLLGPTFDSPDMQAIPYVIGNNSP